MKMLVKAALALWGVWAVCYIVLTVVAASRVTTKLVQEVDGLDGEAHEEYCQEVENSYTGLPDDPIDFE